MYIDYSLYHDFIHFQRETIPEEFHVYELFLVIRVLLSEFYQFSMNFYEEIVK